MDSCVHIYCGEGKGKTTAAVGLAVRAAGCGRKVLLTRFLKTDHSGEVAALGLIPGISVTPCEKSFGFFFRMTDEQKKEAAVYYTELLDMTLSGGWRLRSAGSRRDHGSHELWSGAGRDGERFYNRTSLRPGGRDDRARAVGGTDFPGGLRVRDPKDQASLRSGDPGARGD